MFFQDEPQLNFKVVTFDLFGTLVNIDDACLPHLSLDGLSIPSLLAAPLGRLAALIPAVDLGDVLIAYFKVGEELKNYLTSDRELPPNTHLIRCLERIGVRDQAVVRDVTHSQQQAVLQAARPAADAFSLLKHLRDKGCPLGLVSNLADADEGRELISHLKLTSYFDAMVFSGNVGWRKPDRRIFEAALSALGADALEVLHVGDELRADIWGAGHCGLSTVWLNPDREAFAGEYPPRLQIDRLDALLQLPFARRTEAKARRRLTEETLG